MSSSRSLIFRIISTTVSIVVCAACRIDAQASPAEDASREGDTLLASEQYDEAIKVLTKAISLDPKLACAYEGRGVAYQRSNRLREAIDDFTKELELDPKHAAAFCARAEAYEGLGKYKEAIDDFTQGIAIFPCSYYFLKRSELYERTGEHHLAKEDKAKLLQIQDAENTANIDRCSKTIASNPKDADAYSSRGLTYFTMGDYARAVSDLSSALSLRNDPAASSMRPNQALFYRGQAYAAMGNYDAAIKDYNQVIASIPTCVLGEGPGLRLLMRDLQRFSMEGHLRRGEAYLALKQWQPALDDFTRVIVEFRTGESQDPIEKHPWLASAYRGRAQVYKGKGNAEMADKDFERAKQCGLSR